MALAATACTGHPSPSLPASHQSPHSSPGFHPPAHVTLDGIKAHLAALQDIADKNGGSRAVGTSGYEASVRYIIDVLEQAGYRVQTSPVPVRVFRQEGAGVFREIDPTPTSWEDGQDFRAMMYSTSGSLRGRVVALGVDRNRCAVNYVTFHPGDVALLWEPCVYRQAMSAERHGASAILAYYGADLGHPWAPPGVSIPVLEVTRRVARSLMNSGSTRPTVEVGVSASTRTQNVDSVIAESPSGNGKHVIMLGAHLDSVAFGPGMNDNGSGVAALLDIAQWLAGRHPTSAVRFAFWAGEELGERGSSRYVAHLPRKERRSIRIYLNLDMLASPNYIRGIYAGPAHNATAVAVRDLLIRHFTRMGLPVQTVRLDAGSDHQPFEEAGIATAGVFAGAATKTAEQASRFGGVAGQPDDPCYHEDCDTFAHLNFMILGQLTLAVVDVLSVLAFSR